MNPDLKKKYQEKKQEAGDVVFLLASQRHTGTPLTVSS